MPRLSKEKRVWVCLEDAKYQNAEGVRMQWSGRWVNISCTATEDDFEGSIFKFQYCTDWFNRLESAFVSEI